MAESDLMVAVPERSQAQRRAALAKANVVRGHRKQLKQEVKAGTRSVGAVLLDPAPEEEEMKVIELLLAIPRVGRVKANKWLNRTGISPRKSVGGLSERQRRELLAIVNPTRRRSVRW